MRGCVGIVYTVSPEMPCPRKCHLVFVAMMLVLNAILGCGQSKMEDNKEGQAQQKSTMQSAEEGKEQKKPVQPAKVGKEKPAQPLYPEGENKEQKKEIKAVRSDELETLLENFTLNTYENREVKERQKLISSIEKDYIEKKKIDNESLLSALTAALSSTKVKVRYNVARFLLSETADADKRILPFIQETVQRILDGKLKTFTPSRKTCGGEEIVLLVRLMAKYPSPTSVSLLLQIVDNKRLLEIWGRHIESADGRPLPMRNGKSIFPDIAAALRNCSQGKIGVIKGNVSRATSSKGKELIKKWEKWWEENKTKIMKGKDSGKQSRFEPEPAAPKKNVDIESLLKRLEDPDTEVRRAATTRASTRNSCSSPTSSPTSRRPPRSGARSRRCRPGWASGRRTGGCG